MGRCGVGENVYLSMLNVDGLCADGNQDDSRANEMDDRNQNLQCHPLSVEADDDAV